MVCLVLRMGITIDELAVSPLLIKEGKNVDEQSGIIPVYIRLGHRVHLQVREGSERHTHVCTEQVANILHTVAWLTHSEGPHKGFYSRFVQWKRCTAAKGHGHIILPAPPYLTNELLLFGHGHAAQTEVTKERCVHRHSGEVIAG